MEKEEDEYAVSSEERRRRGVRFGPSEELQMHMEQEEDVYGGRSRGAPWSPATQAQQAREEQLYQQQQQQQQQEQHFHVMSPLNQGLPLRPRALSTGRSRSSAGY